MGCTSSKEQVATVGTGAGAPVEMKAAGDAVVKVEKPEVCGLHVAPLFVCCDT